MAVYNRWFVFRCLSCITRVQMYNVYFIYFLIISMSVYCLFTQLKEI